MSRLGLLLAIIALFQAFVLLTISIYFVICPDREHYALLALGLAILLGIWGCRAFRRYYNHLFTEKLKKIQ